MRETTPFFKENYPPLGSFFVHQELTTRVIILDQDPKEVHEANEAARHLANRYDLRFAYSGDEDVMKDFDSKHHYLRNNQLRNGAFEALVVANHDDVRT